MNAFLLGIHVGMEILGRRVCSCVVSADSAERFSKWLYQFTPPLTVNRDSTCPSFSATLGIFPPPILVTLLLFFSFVEGNIMYWPLLLLHLKCKPHESRYFFCWVKSYIQPLKTDSRLVCTQEYLLNEWVNVRYFTCFHVRRKTGGSYRMFVLIHLFHSLPFP